MSGGRVKAEIEWMVMVAVTMMVVMAAWKGGPERVMAMKKDCGSVAVDFGRSRVGSEWDAAGWEMSEYLVTVYIICIYVNGMRLPKIIAYSSREKVTKNHFVQ